MVLLVFLIRPADFFGLFSLFKDFLIFVIMIKQMKMNLFNFQGGTIKLMVKSLGIDLEEDKGDVIGLDVQDKVKDHHS